MQLLGNAFVFFISDAYALSTTFLGLVILSICYDPLVLPYISGGLTKTQHTDVCVNLCSDVCVCDRCMGENIDMGANI
eukprot:c4775_g1_i1 orf=254-487(+)